MVCKRARNAVPREQRNPWDTTMATYTPLFYGKFNDHVNIMYRKKVRGSLTKVGLRLVETRRWTLWWQQP